MKPPSTFGPNPWHQTQWDGRAAGNFACGGAGAGLVVFAVLSGATGPAWVVPLLGGLGLVGLGLLCVWLEIGRPWRALHVFLNPRGSWMTREALVATALFPVGLAALFLPELKGPAALLALAFVYCQGRILQAAKGIPAWREPLLVPLVVLTGLAEGGGLFLLVQAFVGATSAALLATFALLVIGRLWVWMAYRRRVDRRAARGAVAALDRTGRVLEPVGTWGALALVVLAASGVAGPLAGAWIAAAAGALAASAGGHLKYTLVTRAGFNQGFALAHLPVRGVHRLEA